MKTNKNFFEKFKKKSLRASISLRLFVVFIILLPFTIGIAYISSFKGLFYILISFFIYFLIFLPFSIFWRKVVKKEILNFEEILKTFLYKISIIIFISFVFIWSFSYYNNVISPAYLPTYTLKNSDKTVVFQTMSHIGTQKFYDEIRNDIIKSKHNGYVLFYEGVKMNGLDKKISKNELIREKLLEKYNKNYNKNKKLLEEFNKAIGIKFDKDLYKNFSKLYGLVAQDNNFFLGLVNNNDFNVDLNLEQVMKIYKEKTKNKKNGEKNIDLSKIEDINSKIMDSLSKLNKKELKVLVWINRGMMNFIIKNDDLRNKIITLSGKENIMGVILNDRNKYLAKQINNSQYKKIYVIYGMMHFDGVFKELKSMDSNWKIIEEKEKQFIK